MNNTKAKYEVPQIEVIVLQTADIITTSSGFDGDEHDFLTPTNDGLIWS